MKQTIEAKEHALHKIFSDDFLFIIPPVQRPYSWTVEEVGDLLNDLVDYIERNDIREGNINTIQEPYFLGSLVLVNTGGNRFEVLDGQQRLTTLTLILAVLRDYISDEYSKHIKVMIRQEGNKLLQTKDENRMELRKRDQPFFNKYIQTDKGTNLINGDLQVKTDSQRLLRDNVLYIYDELNNLNPEIVNTLPGVIASLCYMVTVSTPNFDSAFRIFTVLNDRGLDLMESDIFKAKAIGEIDEIDQEEYTTKWEEVEVSLGRDRFNKLFDHIRMIIQKRKGSANLKDEYDEIFKLISGREFIDEILLPYSEIYTKLIDYHTYYGDNPEMIKLLSLMNKIDNADWIPPAMLYIYRHKQGLMEFLLQLEAFAAGAMILRRNFNWRMTHYSAILKEIDANVDSIIARKTLVITPIDRLKVIEALQGDVYIDLKDSAKRYVLLKLDSLLSTGQPYYNHSVISVEHVLPQNPSTGSEWLTTFKEPEKYTHKLGNLVLLTRRKNSQAGNRDFDKKKTTYFQSNKGVSSFAITTQVIQEPKWTPYVIENRQKQLVDMLIKAWRLG